MLSIDCTHPELIDFINIKTDLDKVTKANISVRITDDFMMAVENDEDWVLHFEREGESIKQRVKAKEVFNLLCKNNWDYAEPGILFWDRIENYNLLSQDKEFSYAGVNPCAEEPLPNGGSCLLGSINLSAYVNEDGKFDINSFEEDISIIVKAMNDVLDEGLPLHPLQIQRDTVRDYRQIGIGVMGIADMLIKMGIKYDEPKAIETCELIGFILANQAIKQSALLAKEHGAYPKYNADAIMHSEFLCDNTADDTFDLVDKYGLRNSQLLTIAPTGSISTMIGVSGGIEPIFNLSYTRKTESLHGEDVYYKVFTPIAEEYMKEHSIDKEEDLPDYFVTTESLNPFMRIKMQGTWQKHIDASISSTINLPNEATVEEVESLYMSAWKEGLKGLTIYRAGCKREGILTTEPKKEEIEEIKELKRGEWEAIPDDTIYYKRKVYTGCGKLNLFIGFSSSENKVVEVYTKRSGKGGCEHNIDGEVIAMSGMLRLGGTLDTIEKAYQGLGACPSFTRARERGEKLSKGKSCPSAILNAIRDFEKEMIKDEVEVEYKKVKIDLNKKPEQVGMKCPECGEQLQMTGGCNVCPSCGWTKCQ